ncbi:MAG TPA: Hpt domain-containing protein [Solirubrobacteraceae bacterium]
MDEPRAIDLARFDEIIDLFGSDIGDGIDEWWAELARNLARLRAAAQDRDLDAIAGVAHAIKGAGLTFGATALASAAREAEQDARNGSVPSSAQLDRLSGLAEGAQAALRARTNGI